MLGRTLGHYEVSEPLGAGGMGEVYRARDTRLEREVAIKVLPADFASDPERLARFEREAKLLASLNHPNIAAIYGLEDRDGVRFIAMELVEGETLGERIGRSGRLEMAEVLEIARQIAEALEAAHERGVIHRDLKPANVKITADGKVKVLDFGLAKALAVDGSTAEISPDISNSPTVAAATHAGVILGTAAYMSPEQARGKPVDKRADIWAFGCVLYEMLCGCRPFAGDTTSDTLAAVLTSAPDWSRLPAETPAPIRRLLRRSLEKNLKLRLPDIAMARLEIDEAVATPAADVARAGPPPHARGRRRLVPWGLTALFAAIAAVAVWMGPPPAAPPPPERLVVALPPGQELSLGELGVVNPVALSPDGQLLVYTAAERQTGTTRLFLRPLGQFVDRPIEGTEGAQAPFFSPGGDWIGFFANEALWRVRVAGGPPVKICDTRVLFPSASWGPDDTIVFSHYTFGLYRVSANEGVLEQLTSPDAAAGEVRHFAPQILPGGGGGALFTIASDEGSAAAILSLASNDWSEVLDNAESARYVHSGHLVYAQSGALRAVPFDLARGETRGSSVPLHDSVPHLAGLGAAHFAVSDSGTLAYPPADGGATNTRLVWVDRQGQATPIVDDPAPFFGPRVSPDGGQIAVTVGPDVWVYDVERGTPTVLTTDGFNIQPVWDPSGRLTFSAVRADPAAFFDLHSVAVDRGAGPELLLAREGRQFPSSWSPDGNVLVFFESTMAGGDIAVLENGTVRSLLASRSYSEYSPVFSPDGRWIAYVSDESGREEVYVTRYPGPASSQPISVNGGREPVWSRDGRELFYRKGDLLMAVSVESTNSTFTSGSPQVLFQGRYALMDRGGVAYDVARDGRFVMLQPLEVTSPGINVVLHFVEELKRLAPGGSEP